MIGREGGLGDWERARVVQRPRSTVGTGWLARRGSCGGCSLLRRLATKSLRARPANRGVKEAAAAKTAAAVAPRAAAVGGGRGRGGASGEQRQGGWARPRTGVGKRPSRGRTACPRASEGAGRVTASSVGVGVDGGCTRAQARGVRGWVVGEVARRRRMWQAGPLACATSGHSGPGRAELRAPMPLAPARLGGLRRFAHGSHCASSSRWQHQHSRSHRS